MKARKTTRKAAARPVTARRSIPDRYFALLKDHLARPREENLAAATQLGRDLVLAGLPLEGIRELHAEALRHLDSDFEDMSPSVFAERTAAPLMGLLMAYGSAFREQLDQAERAEEALRESEERYRELFERSPVSIWEEDWSAVKKMIDGLARRGVRNWRDYFHRHPDQVRKANDLIPVVDVSQATLEIYRAPSKEAIIETTQADKMSPGELEAFREHLIAFAEGKTRFDFEVKEPALDGSEIVTYKHAVIPPKYHGDWARVIYAISDITERTEAEKTRRESAERLADITTNMPGTIYRRVLHPDGKISFPHEATGAVHGLDPKEIMEDPDVFIEAIHPEDRGKWHEAVRASAERLERFDHKMRVITPSGETKWARSVAQPHRLDNGDVVWDGVMTDITEQKRAEDALRESEGRLADIAANMPGSIFRRVLHTDGKISFPYYATGAIHDLDPKAVMEDADVFIDTIHPDDRAKWHEAIKASARKLERFDLEMRIITPSGETKWARSVAQPHRLDNGDIVWDGVMTDITEQKRAEKAVRESEGRYRDLFEQSPIGIWEEDYSAVKPMIDRLRRKGVRDFRRYFREHPRVLRQMEAMKKIVNVNQTLLDIYRAPNQEVFLQAATNPSRMGNWGGFYENELTALAEGKTRFTLEYADKALDGSDIVTRTVTHIGEAYKDNWTRLVSTVEDITERKRADDALRESEARFRSLVANVPGDVFERKLTPEGRLIFTYVSPRVREMYNVEPEDVLADPSAFLDTLPAEDRDRWMAALERSARTLSPMDLELRVVSAGGGATRWLRTISRPFLRESGEVVWDGVGIDITEQKRAEEAVRESEERHRELFELSPIGIWEEDYSGAKRMIDRLRKRGVRDFRRYFRKHPEVLRQMVEATKIIDVNPALLDIYRAPDKDTYLRAATDPSRIEQWVGFCEQELAALAEGESRVVQERPDKAFDGSDFVTRIITHIGPAHKDSWARVVSTVENITGRKQADDALRESEGRFRSLAANLPGAVFQRKLTPEGRHAYTYVSPRVRDLYGLEPQDIVADASVLLDAMPVEDRDRWMAALEHSAHTLSPIDLQVRMIAADGATRWVRTISHPFRHENGEVVWDGVDIDITEQKRADDALRESEARFRSLADNLPGVVFQRKLTSDGRLVYTYVSPGMRELYGVEPEKVIADPSAFLQVLPAEEQGRFLAALKHSARTLSPMNLELRVVSADGGKQWQRTISRPFRRESGEVVWNGLALDITEHKRAEEALRASEERHRELFELSPLGIWEEDYSGAKRMIDRLRKKGVRDFRRYFREHPEVLRQMVEATKIIDVNRALLDIYRAPDKDTYLRAATDPSIFEQWVGFCEQELAALAAGEDRVVQERPDKAFDGSDIVTRIITHIGAAHKDSWARVVSTIEDITERKQAETALGESEARFRAVFNCAGIGIVLIEKTGRFVEANPAYQEMLGYSGDELKGKNVLDITHPEDVELTRKSVNDIVMLKSDRFQIEKRYLPKDRPSVWTRVTASAIDGGTEEPDHVIAMVEDITEQKRAEVALRESEARYRELFEHSPIGIVEDDYSGAKRIVDRLRKKGVRDFRRYFHEHPRVLRQMVKAIKFIDVNPALLDIYRAPDKETLLRKESEAATMGEWAGYYEDDLTALAEGESRIVQEYASKTYDGSDIVIRSVTHIREAYKDSWARLVSTVEDITDQKRVQAQLIQAEKLSTLGEMAAGIAHELSQPLNIIRMAADSSLMLLEEGDADLDYQGDQLALIGGQTQRMADIIDHMRIFSRKDGMDAELFDASTSVRNALGLVHEAIHLANIRVAAKVPERRRHVLGHAVQLEQVMVSMLTNAKDAILAHPVPARDRSRGKQRGRITVDLVDDQTSKWIWIIVSDTGGGIPDDVIGHIFDPFYTTKEVGKGTGLGLSVAYGIVTAMGGKIDVWNTTKGARFQITLPVAGSGPRRTRTRPPHGPEN